MHIIIYVYTYIYVYVNKSMYVCKYVLYIYVCFDIIVL